MKDIEKKAQNLKKNHDEKIIRKLSDMKDKFKDKEQVKKVLYKKDPIIYRVYRKEIDEKRNLSLTLMKPGKIGEEFFMTKGHRHDKPDKEIYVLVKGQGKLILQNKQGKTKTISLKKGEEIKIPGDSAHRLVNIGDKTLEVLTIDNKETGRKYSVDFKKRVFS